MKMLTVLSSIVSIIIAIIPLFKGIINYVKNNPGSKLKIYGYSIVNSVGTFIFVYIIAGVYYFYVVLNFSDHSRLFKSIPGLFVPIITITISFLFLVKDRYKVKYAFVIAEDYKLFNKDQKYFTRYTEATSKNLANDFINNKLKSSVKLNKINSLRNEKHQLSKITKKYEFLITITWFVLPLLALNMHMLMFEGYEKKFGFVTTAIIIVLVSVLFIICNSFIVYFDMKLRYGIVNQTDEMLKKHDKQYRKFLDKQKGKQQK